MTNDPGIQTSADRAKERLGEMLELASQQGLTQQAVALRAGLPPSYLSDLKRGHRPMTELVARRLADEFELDYEWLKGTGSTPKRPPAVVSSVGGSMWLPIFPHPIEGVPQENSIWDGTGVELAGSALAKLVRAVDPYVLRFGHHDIQGRLHKKDLILISQDVPKEADIYVVKYRKKAFLARPNGDGKWERVSSGNTMPKTSVIVGHCLGIVWSSL